jgi:hypothetical protein
VSPRHSCVCGPVQGPSTICTGCAAGHYSSCNAEFCLHCPQQRLYFRHCHSPRPVFIISLRSYPEPSLTSLEASDRSVTVDIFGWRSLTLWPYIPASQSNYSSCGIKLIYCKLNVVTTRDLLLPLLTVTCLDLFLLDSGALLQLFPISLFIVT